MLSPFNEMFRWQRKILEQLIVEIFVGSDTIVLILYLLSVSNLDDAAPVW